MLLQAKNSAPQPGFAELISPVFSHIFDHSSTLIAVPEGYLLTDSLASVLAEKDLKVVWICFGPEDRDPAILLLSLVNGVEKVIPGIRVFLLAKMRRQPGPVTGWEPFYSSLAIEINQNTNGLLFVLEGIENLCHSHICLRLLSVYFLENLHTTIRRILISKNSLPKSDPIFSNFVIRLEDLRVDERDSWRIAGSLTLELSQKGAYRAVQLLGGKLSILVSLKESSQLLGPAVLDHEVLHSSNLEDLLNRIARLIIIEHNESAVQVLAMSLNLGYSHTAIRSISQSIQSLKNEPDHRGAHLNSAFRKPVPNPLVDLWHQPLENGWDRLRGYWHQPLQNNLKAKNCPTPEFVHETAAFLVAEKATCAAVNLCFKQKDPTLAAEIIARSAGDMLDLGQWATLVSWIECLAPEVCEPWPILAYVSGKISTASGNIEAARKAFARSSQLYARAHDLDGECRSLQAESALAAWRGDTTFSKERALSAFTLAQRARLTWHEIWSGWHLGALAIAQQDYSEALEWFRSVANLSKSAGYHSVWAMIEQATITLQQQRDLEQEFISRQQSLIANEKIRKENLIRLQNLTNSPFENLDELLEEHGWLNLPLIPITSAWIEPIKAIKPNLNLFRQLLSLINPVWENPPAGSYQNQGFSWNRAPGARMDPQADIFQTEARSSNDSESSNSDGLQPSDHPQANELRVYLLGDFRVEIAGQRLEGWTHNRVCALFKYLMVHRDHYTHRELLMETFWPDSTPEAARNSMNVTIHNLRRILRFPDAIQSILFHEGGYRLNPSIVVWADLDEFEILIREGRRLEAAEKNLESIQRYEAAVALYQGDFLSEDPYDEWPVTQRERLRTLYLDTLDRLSQQYFTQGDFHTSVQLCQWILNRDACREDVHRRVMRCYSRLGQECLAIRQYQICAEALKSELEVEPEASTRQLSEKIRRREWV